MGMLTKRNILIAVVIVALVAALWGARAFLAGSSSKPVETFSKEYGLVLKDAEGKDVRLSEFKRKVLIVTLWASWCPYCGDEIENFSKLQEIYRDDVTIVAVNRAEPAADSKAFTEKLQTSPNVTFLFDASDSLYKSIGGYAMPETIFIDSRGRVIFHQRGPMKMPEMIERVKEMVK